MSLTSKKMAEVRKKIRKKRRNKISKIRRRAIL